MKFYHCSGRDTEPFPHFGAVDRIFSRGSGRRVVLKKKRPVVMPETFDGAVDWPTYRQYFETCSEINGWNEAGQAHVLGVL